MTSSKKIYFPLVAMKKSGFRASRQVFPSLHTRQFSSGISNDASSRFRSSVQVNGGGEIPRGQGINAEARRRLPLLSHLPFRRMRIWRRINLKSSLNRRILQLLRWTTQVHSSKGRLLIAHFLSNTSLCADNSRRSTWSIQMGLMQETDRRYGW